MNYSKRLMLNLIDRDADVKRLYVDRMNEINGGKGFNEIAANIAMKEIFDELDKSDALADIIDSVDLTEVNLEGILEKREYRHLPKMSKHVEAIEKLIKENGWKAFMSDFVFYAKFKEAELHNAGLDDQRQKWTKIVKHLKSAQHITPMF
jgi:hypothetical protein